MAQSQNLIEAIQLCNNALMNLQFLTSEQKQIFRKFIHDVKDNKPITDKQTKTILRQSKKLHNHLTHKVGGPV